LLTPEGRSTTLLMYRLPWNLLLQADSEGPSIVSKTVTRGMILQPFVLVAHGLPLSQALPDAIWCLRVGKVSWKPSCELTVIFVASPTSRCADSCPSIFLEYPGGTPGHAHNSSETHVPLMDKTFTYIYK